MAPGLHRLEEDAEQDEGNAEVEGEVDFTTHAKDEEGEDDGVAGFKIIRQIDGEGREVLQVQLDKPPLRIVHSGCKGTNFFENK